MTTSNESPSESVRILDPEQMQNLQLESPSLLRRLIPLFHSHSDKAFASMAEALKIGDGKTLAECAHTLKGSAANFGAERFMAVCQELEDAGNEGRAETYEKLLDAVRVEYEYLTQALKAS